MNELEKYLHDKDPKALGLAWVVDEQEIRKLVQVVLEEYECECECVARYT